MHLKSRVRRQVKEKNAMFTTVPGGIIAYLQLQDGDKMEWKMERIGEQRVAIVSKI